MTTTTTPSRIAPTIPEKEIREALDRWWAQQDAERASDPFKPFIRVGTLYEVLPAIDSLTIMDAILEIEKVVKFEIPVSCVKKGGYQTREEMITHLLKQIRKLKTDATNS
jgi:acyl carrier protein